MTTIYVPKAPAVSQALSDLLTPVYKAAGVLCKNGAWTSAESAERVVCLGWSGFVPGFQYPSRAMNENLGGADVTSEVTMEGLGPSYREKIGVNCSSIARVGQSVGAMDVARAQVYEHIAMAAATIIPPGWLGVPGVMYAKVQATGQLHQVQDRTGALAVVLFTVDCDAYAQS